MHENVMPWLLENMINYLTDEDYISINVEEVVRDAFHVGNGKHAESM